MAHDLEFPCWHSPTCSKVLKYTELVEHVKVCEMAPIACPALNQCGQAGFAMESLAIVQHLQTRHNATLLSSVTNGKQITAEWNVTNPAGLTVKKWDGAIMKAFNEYFFCCF